MKREKPCVNCGAEESPMVNANDPWCSENCRKAVRRAEEARASDQAR